MLAFMVPCVAIAIVLYVNWPAPDVSEGLNHWRLKGDYFLYNSKYSVFYRDERVSDSDQTLLLLHGFPTSSYDWKKIWPDLVTKQSPFGRVLALDFLGFGFSDKPLHYNYTIKEQVEIVLTLLNHVEVKGDIHVLSHDYGDSVAQEILARFNENSLGYNIKTVCLLNGGMFKITNHPMIGQKLAALPYVRGFAGHIVPQMFFKFSLSKTFGPLSKPSDEDLDEFWQLVRVKDGHLVLGYLLGYIAERAENDIRWTHALSDTTLPVHVIYGPSDVVNPPPFIEYYKKVVPKGTIEVVAGAGHYPHWENPLTVKKYYLRWIRAQLHSL